MGQRIGFGIDVGGSGIKGGRVDLDTGALIGDRIKILTPQPATPEAVAKTIAEIVDIADWKGDIGITIPSVIQNQTALLAANIDDSWVHTDCQALFTKFLPNNPAHVLNDADAAGLAEVQFGDPENKHGAVMLLTFGTGIGSALIHDGLLYPNSELGHLVIDGIEAEHFASAKVKEDEGLSFAEWAERVSKVLKVYESLFWPSKFIVGGGISREHEKWVSLLTCKTPVIPASLDNNAGIAGAAFAAEQGLYP
ncbi:MAG: ROK family protein [Corynebacterium sp.]|uniref:polyphosphate--glucose phosphotransferase n=1 Tax=Corynebacterium sp. TaxID=1720 RepID=UPI0026DC22A8|nr:ROK family protein [Corynebacterium sp.]MDO5029188.1 ROK family protein [Corynebacterium sp.]